MDCMVASSIPCKLSLCADRAHARAGDSHASTGIDFACPTSQSVLAIASPHELPGDSWPSSSTGTSSFCCNQQYSITAVTTSAGAIAERYAYSAYGQPTILDASGTVLPTSNFSLRYSFTGREWDATLGLHHFRARWMSPSAGRFLTRDPIKYAGSEWNLTEYVRSNPGNSIDPFGLSSLPPIPDSGLRNCQTVSASTRLVLDSLLPFT
jgi:RHS repeat-associated protein